MNTTQSQQPPIQTNNKGLMWTGIEIGLLVVGVGFGITLTNQFGPVFLNTFIYPHFKPTQINDSAMTNYLMLVPSLVVCSITLGIVLWQRLSWWKPFGFIFGCIITSLWWISQFNTASFFSGRP